MLKNQRFGVEIEFTGITRRKAAGIAEYGFQRDIFYTGKEGKTEVLAKYNQGNQASG